MVIYLEQKRCEKQISRMEAHVIRVNCYYRNRRSMLKKQKQKHHHMVEKESVIAICGSRQ